jgi:hypothetical protein
VCGLLYSIFALRREFTKQWKLRRGVKTSSEALLYCNYQKRYRNSTEVEPPVSLQSEFLKQYSTVRTGSRNFWLKLIIRIFCDSSWRKQHIIIIIIIIIIIRSRVSVVGIATGYELHDRGLGVRIPVGLRISLLHVVQTGCGVHPTSYLMDTGGSLPESKAAGARIWPLPFNYCRG